MLHLRSRKRDSGREETEVQTEYTICIFKQRRHSRRRTKARHSQKKTHEEGLATRHTCGPIPTGH